MPDAHNRVWDYYLYGNVYNGYNLVCTVESDEHHALTYSPRLGKQKPQQLQHAHIWFTAILV